MENVGFENALDKIKAQNQNWRLTKYEWTFGCAEVAPFGAHKRYFWFCYVASGNEAQTSGHTGR